MGGWIDELAAAFGLEPLSDHESDELLGIARAVAHRVERKDTPLAAFLLGMHVGRHGGDGPREDTLGAAIGEMNALLPAADDGP